MRIRTLAAVIFALLVGTTLAFADATKDDAMAIVKKAIAKIKAEGPEKAYVEINKGGEFLNGELYVIVQTFDAKMLVQSANNKMVGKDLIDAQDVDGNYFSRDLGELERKQVSFWYEFKFVNPATKKIQPKDIYCERLDQTVVCVGVYRP
jgi:cytochrome c